MTAAYDDQRSILHGGDVQPSDARPPQADEADGLAPVAAMKLQITTLSSGYVHIREENSQNNWTQPPRWPCSEDEVEAFAFSHATPEFIEHVKVKATEEKNRILDELWPEEEPPRITEDDFCRGCSELADCCNCCAECGETLASCECPDTHHHPIERI